MAFSDLAFLIIIGGVECAGKTELVNQLISWLDARGVEVFALDDPTDEEKERPYMWRFWVRLPKRGRMAIFLGSWYTEPIVDMTFKKIGKKEFEKKLEEIVLFEEMLYKEGFIVLKFWLHMEKEILLERMKKLMKNPLERWRVSKRERKFVQKYDKFVKVSNIALGLTDTQYSRWNIVDASEPKSRDIFVAEKLVETIENEIEKKEKEAKAYLKSSKVVPPKNNLFERLDYSQKIDEESYKKRLLELQMELHQKVNRMQKREKSLILVFEGPDAAGKGGTIRRIISALNAKDYRVMPVAAPTDEEKARPYLWRFWRNLPKKGKITIYDRSWYGRVLVERIEGFCSEEEWQRAYYEINQFEKELTESNIVVIKFYLTITQDEQLKRFKERELTPYKQYKITEEDWRNRAKFKTYEACALEMFEKTNMPYAPWYIIPANDKNFARIKVLEKIVERL